MNEFDRNQSRIAVSTLRMPDAMLGVMGGMTKEEARNVLMLARTCSVCGVEYRYRQGETWLTVNGQLFCSDDCVNNPYRKGNQSK